MHLDPDFDERFDLGGGLFTRDGRCKPYLDDMNQCKQSSPLPKRDCMLFFEDYFECLTRTRQVLLNV